MSTHHRKLQPLFAAAEAVKAPIHRAVFGQENGDICPPMVPIKGTFLGHDKFLDKHKALNPCQLCVVHDMLETLGFSD